MKVLIACGGSGGHIFPAIALAQELKEKHGDIELLFVGSNTALDKRIFEKEGRSYRLISSNKLPYRKSFKTLLFIVKLFFDFLRSLFIIARYVPDVVVGFGGYVASPIVAAAAVFRKPVILHEQNVVPGRANAMLFRFAKKIALSFGDTKKYLGRYADKAVVTGNPIRTSLLKDDKAANIRKLGLSPDKFTVLVVGGSQGAHNLNYSALEAFKALDAARRGSIQIIHITGITDFGWANREYQKLGIEHRVFSFVDNIEEAYSASDIVVTRSGASAIFEIAYFGRPMILVPYPFAMSHQTENAKIFSRGGAAIQIDEAQISGDVMRRNIEQLLNDSSKMSLMSKNARSLSVPDSSSRLASEILKAA